MADWDGASESDLKTAGAEPLSDGRRGLRLKGWHIESIKRPILGSLARQELEEKLGTSHLPEMGWMQEALPPVEVPAAAKWKFRSKPSQQVILDYDYTFTTPYCGSETSESELEKTILEDGCCSLHWEDCDERIDLAVLSMKEPILFYDEVVLYEDELADNGVSLLTVKVRVMPSCWFLLLRYWLRVDGVLMRLRDTRVYCSFASDDKVKPIIIRENCWREATIESLSVQGFPSGSAAYADPNLISQNLPIVKNKTQRLKIPSSLSEHDGGNFNVSEKQL
ncbi:TIP41-like protein isoform X2 [Musa acuminata AAA Group]|uniref:TIP41-like protein isoform X2 n=1 Tax=Musa acuminata AAA Group TaxID=214697 RepID=UPI0031DE6DFA